MRRLANGHVRLLLLAHRRVRERADAHARIVLEALRQFIRDHGDRPLDSFGRDEAITWALAHGRNVQLSVRQCFNHALDRELIDRNPFARIGASKRKRRIDRPDFELITNDQYERLRRCARASRADDYGLIIEGAIPRRRRGRDPPQRGLRARRDRRRLPRERHPHPPPMGRR